MRQKAREFYEEAKLLAAAKKFNGAASRLYYALYHLIIAIFNERGIKQSELTSKVDPNNPGYWLHEVVRNNFTLAGIERRERATILDAWEYRVMADYSDRSVKSEEVLDLLPRVSAILVDLGS
ncbi:MAG TPA: hypothetical protein VKX17_03690 [Planctomycetota bacterium]|nr:hypothetical protein [Planctomycetota bacterium]